MRSAALYKHAAIRGLEQTSCFLSKVENADAGSSVCKVRVDVGQNIDLLFRQLCQELVPTRVELTIELPVPLQSASKHGFPLAGPVLKPQSSDRCIDVLQSFKLGFDYICPSLLKNTSLALQAYRYHKKSLPNQELHHSLSTLAVVSTWSGN